MVDTRNSRSIIAPFNLIVLPFTGRRISVLMIFSDNEEERCFHERKILVVDKDNQEAFIYSMIICSSGGGGWVTSWDGNPTDRDMEVLGFIYSTKKEE